MASPIDVRSLRTVAVVNTSSGSCDESALARLNRTLADAGIVPREVACVGSEALSETFGRIAAIPHDLLIVLGGDGTIRSAAERFASVARYFMPLPGGTMNMLPGALYGRRNWTDALEATLANPKSVTVSGGEVGPHRFFCAAVFGAPALWADAREAVRLNRFGAAARSALHAWHRAFSRRVGYRIGGTAASAEALAVICPLISRRLASHTPALEAAALDLRGARDAFGLALHAAFAEWRSDPHVRNTTARQIMLTSHGALPAILDGEAVRLPRRSVVTFVPECFTALVPA
jgi:diacylglycerol kinase family enzyme